MHGLYVQYILVIALCQVQHDIIYKFLIFSNYFRKSLGDWNNSKIWETGEIFVDIARGYWAMASSLLACKDTQEMRCK